LRIAELYVIFHGLCIAYDAGYMEIILELDSRVTLNLVMSDVQHHHTYNAALSSQIVRLYHQDWIADFHHALCQSNECADGLAKHVASTLDALKF